MLSNQTIHEFRKNAGEMVKVSLGNYLGADVVSIWVFYNSGDTEEEWRPTKKGISLQTSLIPELKKGVDNAYKEYQRMNSPN